MKKSLPKFLLIILVFAIIGLIPLNNQTIFGYDADGRSDGGSSNPAPQCNGARPGAPILYQPGSTLLPRATGVGEVRLNWVSVPNASSYGVGVGLASGNYIYGSPNVGDTTNFTVRFLTPGKKYFFAVRANNGCTPGPWSKEWSLVVGGGGATLIRNANVLGNTTTNSFQRPVVVTQPPQPTTVQPTTPSNVNKFSPPVITPQPEPQLNIFQKFLRIFGIGA